MAPAKKKARVYDDTEPTHPMDVVAEALEVIHQAGLDIESCDELAEFLSRVAQAKVAYDELLAALDMKPILQTPVEE